MANFHGYNQQSAGKSLALIPAYRIASTVKYRFWEENSLLFDLTSNQGSFE